MPRNDRCGTVGVEADFAIVSDLDCHDPRMLTSQVGT